MTSVVMPAPDAGILSRRAEIARALSAIVPGEGVVSTDDGMRPFETDGLTAYRQMPLVVVLPETTEQVAAVLRYCHDNAIPVVPRGSGTSLSGGALPLEDGVLLAMTRFNRVLEIDYDNRAVTVQPGVTNLAVTKAVADKGFYYAPDPSSQIACSIGGNVAENSGGVHCLKYGLTANNLLGVELVLISGEVVRLGGKHLDFRRAMTCSASSPARRACSASSPRSPSASCKRRRRRGRCCSASTPRRPAARRWRRSSPPASFPAAWR